jgi:hypothetical protein
MATPRERTAIRLGVVVLCLSAVPATVAAELACERLLIASAAELLTAADPDFSGRSLKNDILCQPDSGRPGRCEWEGRIVDDRVLESRAGSERRLVRLNDDHLTGSGAWDYLSVFICVAGNTVPVFRDRFHHGVRVEEASPQILSVISGEWNPPDPTCRPSRRKRQVYQWDSVCRLYILDSLTYLPVEM